MGRVPTRAAAAVTALVAAACVHVAAADAVLVYWDCPGSCSSALAGRSTQQGAPSSQPLTLQAVSVGSGCNSSDYHSASSQGIAVATEDHSASCTFGDRRMHAYFAGFSALVYVVADPAAVPTSGSSALSPDTVVVVKGPLPSSAEGVTLSIVSECTYGACGAHGVCQGGMCQCVGGYSGPICTQEPEHPCGEADCGDHRRCEDAACTCLHGYSGDDCESPPAKPPRLSVQPSDGVTITVDTTSDPLRGKAVLTASNVGGSTLRVSHVDASAAKWLSVTPEALSLGAGATKDFQLEADASTLQPGTYQCLLALTDNTDNGNTDVPVTLIVTGVHKGQHGPKNKPAQEKPFDSWSEFWGTANEAAFLPGFLVGAGTTLALAVVAACCRPLCRCVIRVWATLSGRELQHLEAIARASRSRQQGNVRFERVKGTDTDEDEEAALSGGGGGGSGGGGGGDDGDGDSSPSGAEASPGEFKAGEEASGVPASVTAAGEGRTDRGLEMREMAGTQARWAPSEGEVETLILHPSPNLAPSQLEAKWQAMGGNSMLWGFSLARVPSPGELEAALAASNIMCLASGEVENLLKYYFFAEQHRSRTESGAPQALFLLEVSVSKDTCHLTAVLKGDRVALVPQLRDIMHRALAPLGR